MQRKSGTNVCPVEKAGGLDNKFRKLVQNPKIILYPYISPGMSILDVGCGPGFFTIEMAKMLRNSGKVVAADLQYEMLEIVKNKSKKHKLTNRIKIHKCKNNEIGLNEQFDFVLAFYMVHEVPDQVAFFKEIKNLLYVDGKLLIIEPLFHVNKKKFNTMLANLNRCGYKLLEYPKVFFSRAVLAG